MRDRPTVGDDDLLCRRDTSAVVQARLEALGRRLDWRSLRVPLRARAGCASRVPLPRSKRWRANSSGGSRCVPAISSVTSRAVWSAARGWRRSRRHREGGIRRASRRRSARRLLSAQSWPAPRGCGAGHPPDLCACRATADVRPRARRVRRASVDRMRASLLKAVGLGWSGVSVRYANQCCGEGEGGIGAEDRDCGVGCEQPA
jgi:hypothetical protein